MPNRRASRPLLLALALPWLACSGNENVPVAVRLKMDRNTCLEAEPVDLALQCGGRIGTWLVADGEDIPEATRCVGFEPSVDMSLADVPALLARSGQDVEDLPQGTMLSAELAVYSPWLGAECPHYVPQSGAEIGRAHV